MTFDTPMHNFLDSIPRDTALFDGADGQWKAAALRARVGMRAAARKSIIDLETQNDLRNSRKADRRRVPGVGVD